MIDLTGQTALVTGGSRGIGRAAALLLAQSGADVALTFHTRADEAESTAREVQRLGRRAFVGGGDLADPEVVDRLVAGVKREFGGLDIFVANAGVWPAEEIALAELPLARWRRTVAANLDSVFLTARAVLGVMRPGGRVVIVSSTAGQRGEAYHADYAATKGALIALTKSLAVEYAPDVIVNCVAPGWVDTEMSSPAFTQNKRSQIERSIPLRRIATAEDVAGPILFLCSTLSRHITGEVLNVNGGSVLCG
ncbi:MAG TPA: SDR family NAD(P)-dependent oxidoreductase [Gemmatimonadales bacterium]|jgi:3-oxoacyl-[acyl-carrier protein] reductase|nr:SDR family NAD(P)-dependent oxidoreductase [Gemmatimonadales bacterium]